MTLSTCMRPAVAILAGVALSACAASARQRPLNTSPTETGTGTVEAERRQLEGGWTLVSLDVTTEDGRKVSVQAAGTLRIDEFANVNIEYRLSDEGLALMRSVGVDPPNPTISTSGRAAIDPAQHRITYIGADAAAQAFDREAAARRANPFALERPRYYSLDAGGILTLSTRHDNGRDAATSRWRRTG